MPPNDLYYNLQHNEYLKLTFLNIFIFLFTVGAKLSLSMDVVTSPLAYICLNSRNNKMWWGFDVQRKEK